tara:strand:+ start:329 stop:460 length:132 start_codon:yes stop_codon:yes gene_type:complete
MQDTLNGMTQSQPTIDRIGELNEPIQCGNRIGYVQSFANFRHF